MCQSASPHDQTPRLIDEKINWFIWMKCRGPEHDHKSELLMRNAAWADSLSDRKIAIITPAGHRREDKHFTPGVANIGSSQTT